MIIKNLNVIKGLEGIGFSEPKRIRRYTYLKQIGSNIIDFGAIYRGYLIYNGVVVDFVNEGYLTFDEDGKFTGMVEASDKEYKVKEINSVYLVRNGKILI